MRLVEGVVWCAAAVVFLLFTSLAWAYVGHGGIGSSARDVLALAWATLITCAAGYHGLRTMVANDDVRSRIAASGSLAAVALGQFLVDTEVLLLVGVPLATAGLVSFVRLRRHRTGHA